MQWRPGRVGNCHGLGNADNSYDHTSAGHNSVLHTPRTELTSLDLHPFYIFSSLEVLDDERVRADRDTEKESPIRIVSMIEESRIMRYSPM